MKTHLANSRFSKKPSRKQLATRKRLTLALISLLALAFAGFPALRRAEFSRRVGAQNPTVAPSIKFDTVVNSTGDGDAGSAITCDDGNGRCTLRSAIRVANASPDHDVISFGNFLASDAGCSMGVCTINLGSALPDLSTDISITGPGADKLTVRYKIGPQSRIFKVTTTGVVTISGMTISNGNATPDKGGGIQNFSTGTVNVTNCTLSGNFTSGSASSGGGIDNGSTGMVNVTNCTLSSNSAAVGGGISNSSTGSVFVTNSTISGNSAGSGGGISNSSTGRVIVTYSSLHNNAALGSIGGPGSGGGIYNVGLVAIGGSTLDGNVAQGGSGTNSPGGVGAGGAIYSNGTLDLQTVTLFGNAAIGGGGGVGAPGGQAIGGGVFNLGTAQVSNSTLCGNRVSRGSGSPEGQAFGGGIAGGGGNMQIKSTIIAGNTNFSNTASPDVSGAVGSQGFNLIGENDGATTNFPAGNPNSNNDIVGTSASASRVDPKLDPAGLKNNGGPTQTIALLFGSPAIDKGTSKNFNPGTLVADQRGTGFPRTFDDPNVPNASGSDGTDIGAFEVQTAAPTPTPTPTPSPTPTPTPTPTLSINDVSVAEGNSGTTSANFTVSLSAASLQSVSVNFATANGTATTGSDYVGTSGTLTFTPGQTSKTITVLVAGDTTFEPDETFFVDLSTPDNATITRSRGTGTILNDDAATTTIQFSASLYVVGEGDQRVTLTVTRSGDASGASSVGFVTSDSAGSQSCNVFNGNASSRCDYLTSIGPVQFAAGETSRTFSIPIIDDSYAEGNETFAVSLNNAAGASLGTQSATTVMIVDNETTTGPNPIDQSSFFVRQHYLDFLNREPDPSGLNFWVNNIESCGADANCRAVKRIDTSAAFFLSIEFQGTGYLVERIYKASYGDATGASTFPSAHQLSVPIVRLNEFLPDTQEIGRGVVVGQGNWEQQLENNKQAFTLEFVQRSQFMTAFPNSMTPAQFVDRLFLNAGVTPAASDRTAAINEFGSATTTADVAARSRALRDVAENSTLNQQEFNRAFVLMQFLGYLRRNPNDAPDADYTGYDFWLTKLNQFNGNYGDAEMVKAFLASSEYRHRFGP